jgi:uncharacterized protein YecE (DUF72 family)
MPYRKVIMLELTSAISNLARDGVLIGTSSWKYPGWLGQLYSPQRYQTRGKFSEAKFERSCLAEYAETFSTVCVDAGYYAFPREDYLAGLAEQVPEHFRFGFKVTDEITIKRFPNLPRFGPRAGQVNEHFLNAELFARAFLTPCETIREKVGVLIFEFSHFHERDFARGRDFLPLLDGFLAALPRGWQYAVECRNKTFLHPEYFAVLRAHGVAHCFNAWERMPPVSAQMALPESRTADFLAGRFLLTAGRKYEAAVSAFSPYTETRAPDPDARDAARRLILEARRKLRQASYFFINNRLEGNALNTIAAITADLPAA